MQGNVTNRVNHDCVATDAVRGGTASFGLPDISREFLNLMMDGIAMSGVAVNAGDGQFRYNFG